MPQASVVVFWERNRNPTRRMTREGDGGDKDGPSGKKNKEAFQPLLMVLTPDDTAVIEAQISEFMGGELQSDLEKPRPANTASAARLVMVNQYPCCSLVRKSGTGRG